VALKVLFEDRRDFALVNEKALALIGSIIVSAISYCNGSRICESVESMIFFFFVLVVTAAYL
jgi:hypothetical protein